MNFTEKIYPKSNRPVAVIFTSLLVTALFCCCTITSARAAVLFDNISNFENSAPGANITSTASTPNTFMGAGYNLISGADAITGFDIFPGNLSGVNFNALRITMYVWGTVNTSGTVNSSTPAFGNLLATYTLDATGAFNSGFYFPFEGAATGVDPGLILGTPLSIPGTLIGITFN